MYFIDVVNKNAGVDQTLFMKPCKSFEQAKYALELSIGQKLPEFEECQWININDMSCVIYSVNLDSLMYVEKDGWHLCTEESGKHHIWFSDKPD